MSECEEVDGKMAKANVHSFFYKNKVYKNIEAQNC